MTVIAIKRLKDSIEIASDHQTTCGHNKTTGATKDKIYREANKIFKTNGMVFGIAGHVKGNSLMQMFAKNHKPKTSDEDGIIDFLVEFQEWAKKKDADFKLDMNHYILVIEKKMFEIVDGLLVREINEYGAIGSGSFLALGALYYSKSVDQAIEVAKEFDLYCGGKTKKIIINI